MTKTTDLLMSIRSVVKFYEHLLKPVCEKYQLTQMEADIISFLKNNPGKDTVGDIAELRMFSKGNVSCAVEKLMQKSMLQRENDREDRRKVHLLLRPEAESLIRDIEAVRMQFKGKLFRGFSEEELEEYERFNQRIRENAKTTGRL